MHNSRIGISRHNCHLPGVDCARRRTFRVGIVASLLHSRLLLLSVQCRRFRRPHSVETTRTAVEQTRTAVWFVTATMDSHTANHVMQSSATT